MNIYTRRNFLRTSILGGAAASFIKPIETLASFGQQQQLSARTAITSGDNRADLVFRALQPFSEEIARSIGNRRVVLKPNNVTINIPLSATHADTLEGILEFLKSIRKDRNVTEI